MNLLSHPRPCRTTGVASSLTRNGRGLARTLRLRNRQATIVAAVLFAAAVLVGIPGAFVLCSRVARVAIVGVALGIAVS